MPLTEWRQRRAPADTGHAAAWRHLGA